MAYITGAEIKTLYPEIQESEENVDSFIEMRKAHIYHFYPNIDQRMSDQEISEAVVNNVIVDGVVGYIGGAKGSPITMRQQTMGSQSAMEQYSSTLKRSSLILTYEDHSILAPSASSQIGFSVLRTSAAAAEALEGE